MGKRNKKAISSKEDVEVISKKKVKLDKSVTDDTQAEATEVQSSKKRVKKVKKDKSVDDDIMQPMDIENENCEVKVPVVAKKSKKKVNNDVTEINHARNSENTPNNDKKKKVNMKLNKQNKGVEHASSISQDTAKTPKKITFNEDGEPQKIPNSSVGAVSNTKKKQFLNDDEAEVKDEDIDEFCDELGEEDNVQFENWVRLVEEKLHSKKVK